jgi:predicted nucleic acid-binding protein
MQERACLDAGVIYLYYRKNAPEKVDILINKIKNQTIIAYIPKTTLIEVYKHLCVSDGKNFATSCVSSFQHNVIAQYISLTSELILIAGQLKCQYRLKLSYNDCIALAIALQKKAKFHTTEKNLPKIENLQIVKYDF